MVDRGGRGARGRDRGVRRGGDARGRLARRAEDRVPQRDTARDEITVLRLANGDGCVRLLRDDVARGALLVERLGAPLCDLGLPLERRLEVLCDAASRVWRRAAGCGLRSGAEKGRWLADFIAAKWEETGRPCAERTVAHALACAARRVEAHDDERAVLVHGDVHQWNALRAGDPRSARSTGGWKLVDPDGLLAEAEYDLGILMREDPEELHGDGRERARWLARRTGTDAEAIWEWGVVGASRPACSARRSSSSRSRARCSRWRIG